VGPWRLSRAYRQGARWRGEGGGGGSPEDGRKPALLWQDSRGDVFVGRLDLRAYILNLIEIHLKKSERFPY